MKNTKYSADPGQFLTYLTITSILAKVRGNGQAERRSVHVGCLVCNSVSERSDKNVSQWC
ncbi:hypothetical protein NQ317_004555 [Molorchus minor]|uniref:Uncharacterized protein n=1 Tax=Molorchus minor TaxID=1323400 RepID=A0ABQ9J2Y9_9CUCU|nr:hypothetical protein NQ317_004555 [Molorchus minor]